MVLKMITIIFCLKIPHHVFINVSVTFLPRSTFFVLQKIRKNFKMPTSLNMADISAPSINTRTSLLKSAKASSLFCVCVCVIVLKVLQIT